MYIEKRNIKGKEYLYAKVSARVGTKVGSRTVAYLGTSTLSKKKVEEKMSSIPESKIVHVKEEIKQNLKKKSVEQKEEFLSSEQKEKISVLREEFLKKMKTLPEKLIDDMLKDFKLYYIYNTTAIEGNTLTLQEADLILNKNITPDGKELREVFDHINERTVFDWMRRELPEITVDTILKIHAMLLENIDARAGKFRTHNVRVVGAEFSPTQAEYVQTDMNIILQWYRENKKTMHPLVLASIFHEKFERVHPFYDGNGRTGRMLLNLTLLKGEFPPLIVKNKDRLRYYEVLSKGHNADLTKNNQEQYKDIVLFFYEQIIKTYEEIFEKWG